MSPAAILNVPAVTALKSTPDAAVPPDVLQLSTVSASAGPDCLTVNSTPSPSAAEAEDTDTVSRTPSSVAQLNADVSLLVAAVSPSRLRCVHSRPPTLRTWRLKATSVTGATKIQRLLLCEQPSSTFTSTSAFSRLKNQSRPDWFEAQMPPRASPITPAPVS